MSTPNRSVFVALIVMALPCAASQPESTATPVTIPRTEQFDIKSKAGLEYRIFVAGPVGNPPEAGSPVIYLTDGNVNFPVLHAAARRQSMRDSAAVVVGIGYPSNEARDFSTRRSFDLVPTASAEWLKSLPKAASMGKTGGNDQFLSFINDELKPLIEKKFKIDKHRQTLFGHSFGGLFTLHVLFNKPESFQSYLASSPSLWWADNAILAQEKAFGEKSGSKSVDARLFISVGEWEQKPGPKVPTERAAMLKERRMVSNARELAERLSSRAIKGLTVTFREFAEEDHGSVVLPAASRGVRFALDAAP